MNKKLKAYAVEHLGVPADADDKQFEAAIVEAHAKGDLTWEQIQELGREDEPQAEDDLEAAADLIGKSVAAAQAPILAHLEKMDDRLRKLETLGQQRPPESQDDEPADEPTPADKMVAAAAKATPSPGRMKDPIEAAGYSTAKRPAVFPEFTKDGRRHPRAGQRVTLGSGENARPMFEMSDAEAAQVGAFIKWNLSGGGRLAGHPYLNEHERQLMQHVLDKGEWVCGEPTHLMPCWDKARRLDARQKAALVDDTTSGGSYAVPRAFDDQLFMEPVLYGEVVPWVSILDLPAGSVVDGAYLSGTISLTSNVTEGSPITLFDATGLISNLDTTIYTCAVGIEMGLDWLSDQAMDLGRIIPQRMGERLREWLDNQIVNGDGTTEPEGILTKSGTGSSSSTNGTSGPITVNDIENLVFGITKARRARSKQSARFVTSDLMYKRACSVPVGSSDARRVLKPDMDHENYTLMGRGVSIQENVSNGTMAFCALDEYRLIRRLGSQFRETQEGATLVKSNSKIVVLRARFGGQLTLAAACHKITDLDQSIAV